MKRLSNSWREERDGPSLADRRVEPRQRADGLVRLFTLNDERLAIEGEMIDVSTSGFRLEHTNARVRSGEEYIFESPYSSGIARVMWNRILAEAVETGFFIVSSDPEV